MTQPVDTSKMSDGPGTWNVATDEAVIWADAIRDWSAAATAELLNTASSYNKLITYKQLAEAIQSSTGVRTRSLLNNWIGEVLRAVAVDCEARGEVQLTAVCVRQDGTVGPGYAKVVGQFKDGVKPADPELHAADERLRCYQKYAADLPVNGGWSQLTPQVAAKRRAAAPEVAPKLCLIHNTVLPRSGQCDECA